MGNKCCHSLIVSKHETEFKKNKTKHKVMY